MNNLAGAAPVACRAFHAAQYLDTPLTCTVSQVVRSMVSPGVVARESLASRAHRPHGSNPSLTTVGTIPRLRSLFSRQNRSRFATRLSPELNQPAPTKRTDDEAELRVV